MSRPNIIFSICHDLGKHLGCYDAIVQSPNLDQFAQDGIQFNRAYCNSAACSPARGCLMTGKYAHNNGLIGLAHLGWGLPQDQKTVVDYLNEAGYETVHIGHSHERHANENHYQIDVEEDNEMSRTDNVVNDAIDFLRNRRESSTPFYLNLSVNEVHASKYAYRYDDPYGGITPAEDVYIPHHVPDEAPLRRLFGKFQSAIRYMDTQLGRLFRAIDELGYRDNSIVVFTTDHGISNMRSKGTVYERGMEVSLLMQLPNGCRNGRQVDCLTPHIDVTPTLLEACGIPVPDDVQGRSFWPLLTDEPYTPNDAIFTERNYHADTRNVDGVPVDDYDPQRAIRTGSYHYIRRFRPELRPDDYLPWEYPPFKEGESYGSIWPKKTKERPAEELYHLGHDPAELINLADRPEYRHVKAELNAKLEVWMAATEDFATDGPVPEPWAEEGWGLPRPADEIRKQRLKAGLKVEAVPCD